MFRKLSAALYHVTHRQIASTANWSVSQQRIGLKGLLGNVKDSATDSLFRYELPLKPSYNKKLTIVGSTKIGLDIAFNCLDRELCNQICIMDCFNCTTEDRKTFITSPYIKTTNCFPDTRNSDLIVVTKDMAFKKYLGDGSNQMTNVMKCIIPNLVKYSPNSLLFIDTEERGVINEVSKKLHRFPTSHILHPNHKIIRIFKDKSSDKLHNTTCNSGIKENPFTFCSTDVATTILANFNCIKGLTLIESSNKKIGCHNKPSRLFLKHPVVSNILDGYKFQNKIKFKKIVV